MSDMVDYVDSTRLGFLLFPSLLLLLVFFGKVIRSHRFGSCLGDAIAVLLFVAHTVAQLAMVV